MREVVSTKDAPQAIGPVSYTHLDVYKRQLHDSVEDTSVTIVDIRKEFGEQVAHIVEGVTLSLIHILLRAIEFRGRDHLQRNRLLPGKGNCVGKLGARQAGRVGNDRQHTISQRLMGRPRQVRGIHAAGISDEHASQFAQMGFKQRLFCLDIGSSV